MRNDANAARGGAPEPFGYLLAALPALAVVTAGATGLAAGAAALFALILAGLILSALRGLIRPEARAFSFALLAAVAASMADMLLLLIAPKPSAALGPYLPLAALGCALTGYREFEAPDFKAGRALLLTLRRGAGFLIALTLIGCLREALGSGALFGLQLGDAFQPMRLIALTPGGFILAGTLLAVAQWIASKRAKGGEGA